LLARDQPIPPAGANQGGAVTLNRGGFSASVSPLVLLTVAAVVLFVVLKK
jgi:hypothetical protein